MRQARDPSHTLSLQVTSLNGVCASQSAQAFAAVDTGENPEPTVIVRMGED